MVGPWGRRLAQLPLALRQTGLRPGEPGRVGIGVEETGNRLLRIVVRNGVPPKVCVIGMPCAGY